MVSMQVDRLKAVRGQACVITHNFGRLSWPMKSSCWCIGQPQGFQKKNCLVNLQPEPLSHDTH